jgi:hypothetical protein
MSSHDVERDLFALGGQALVDELERKRQEWREEWAADNTPTDDATRAHNARLRAMEESHRQWLVEWRKNQTGAADAPADSQGQVGAATAGRNAPAPGGPGPGHDDPRAAALAEAELAERVRLMPMNEYAAMRAELGVQSPTSMNRLFSQETR